MAAVLADASDGEPSDVKTITGMATAADTKKTARSPMKNQEPLLNDAGRLSETGDGDSEVTGTSVADRNRDWQQE